MSEFAVVLKNGSKAVVDVLKSDWKRESEND